MLVPGYSRQAGAGQPIRISPVEPFVSQSSRAGLLGDRLLLEFEESAKPLLQVPHARPQLPRLGTAGPACGWPSHSRPATRHRFQRLACL